MRRIATLILAATLPMLQGCIVWDINDNLTSINEQLTDVDNQLTRVDSELTTINQQLTDLRTDLEPLPELTKLEQLAVINSSLAPIEKHLASLRRTIANINSTIPFLNISDDTGEEEELQPTTEPAKDPAAESSPKD
jgi:predicted  nucleic acid-binding Zn-ribbon protein